MATAEFDRAAIDVGVELSMNGGVPVDNVIQDAMRDLDGEMTFALALLAAIDAAGDSLQREQRPSKPARKGRAASQRDIQVDALTVTRFELSGARQAESPEATGASGIGGSSGARARHIVRGHLFLARNGVMTYRKKHWRGGIGVARKTLRKVV